MYKTLYKKMIIILTLIISLFMITACSGVNENPISNVTEESENSGIEDTENQDHESTESIYDIDQENQRVEITKLYDDEANYDPTSIIIKLKKSTLSNERNPEIDNDLKDLGIEKLTYLLDTSTDEFEDTGIWFNALLNEGIDSKSIIEEINQLEIVELVELNYVYENEAIDFPKVIDNPRVQEQWYLKNACVQDAWYWLEQEGYEAGGSSSVVIAIIDTGVDYKHIDLAANMWKNPNEIPNNGIDDDGNGFIDDVHGVNVVSDERFHSGDPMDDHGHGTHVAGIATAANNKEGIVGVAYNSKIMAIKAGNASGYFLQTDIAEAILYAYEHGADVINMSFGGTTVSNLVQDALAVAYTRTVLVASAGNDGAPNQGLGSKPNYPAAYSYVIGVMSINQSNIRSGFSNYDGIPFNYIEYEMYAPGEGIVSTLPNGQYASWSGTSMAAPIVSGVAALLRSYYTDRDQYPNRFIMGQIAGTVEMDVIKFVMPDGTHLLDNDMGRLNGLSALMTEPKPNVKFYDYTVFDSVSISEFNNQDKIVDSGEMLHLGVTVKNRWGMASNVNVSINATSPADVVNPYVEFINDSVDYQSVGTLSTKDNGYIFENFEHTAIDHPFIIKISDNTPNDYQIRFNVEISYNNSLDEKDTTVYTSTGYFNITVRNGVVLPSVIEEDMILVSSQYYIISNSVLIPEGVTVQVEEGTTIQFGGTNLVPPYSELLKPSLIVRGSFETLGTKENVVKLLPSLKMSYLPVIIKKDGNGTVNLSYTRIDNPYLYINTASHLILQQTEQILFYPYGLNSENDFEYTQLQLEIRADMIENSIFKNFLNAVVDSSLYNNLFDNNGVKILLGYDNLNSYYNSFEHSWRIPLYDPTRPTRVYDNNVFLINNVFYYDVFAQSGGYYVPSEFLIGDHTGEFNNNAILNRYLDTSPIDWMKIYSYYYFNEGRLIGQGPGSINYNTDYSQYEFDLNNTYFGMSNDNLIGKLIQDYYDTFYAGKVTYSIADFAPETLYPFVTNVSILNSDQQIIQTVANETVTFVVEFNRDMDTSIPLDFRFGSSMPYAEFKVEGTYVSSRRWEGIHTFNTVIENGYQYMNITNGASAQDDWFVLGKDVGRFAFLIDTTAAQALIMQGSANKEGISLNWMQDDFETLAGYNVYRSTSEDGFYQRLNNSIIEADVKTFFDDTVEPGVTYYYNFTVVKTDLSESIPSGKIVIQSLDTMAPNIYHTPVYETFINQNLLIRANIIDNLSIKSAKVYYRTTGQTEWNVANMTANNDQYSVVIPSSALSLNGLEYYIEAYDGISYTYKGIDSDPHQVVVKNAIDENAYGDVNGDGVITVLDALMLLQAINDRINLTSDQFLRADLNENGVLEAWEALRILQYTSGKVTTIR